jgi:hypothetical protein
LFGCEIEGVNTVKDIIWDDIFDLKRIKNKLKSKYEFDYAILTDGYSTSIRYINKNIIPQINAKKARIQEGRLKKEEDKKEKKQEPTQQEEQEKRLSNY